MIETQAEYIEKLEELKSNINGDIKNQGFCMLDKNSISWEQLVDLATDYKFKYPLDTNKFIRITKVEEK